MCDYIFIHPGGFVAVSAATEADAWAVFNARYAEFLTWEEYSQIKIERRLQDGSRD